MNGENISSIKQFFITGIAKCPYLDGQLEQKIFTDLKGEDAQKFNTLLTQNGFRRSQSIIYRPICAKCSACLSTRVLVDRFSPSRNMQHILKTNKDLIGEQRTATATSEMYGLFTSYVTARHNNGGMNLMTVQDFTQMVEDTYVTTHIVEYRKRSIDSSITGRGEGELLAAVLVDRIEDGLSLVYSFFNPNLSQRSLGTFIILDQINRSKRFGLPYLYLGYLVKNSTKMAYKARFQPQEYFSSQGWIENKR